MSQKISASPAASTPLSGSEVVAGVQSGVTVKIPMSAITVAAAQAAGAPIYATTTAGLAATTSGKYFYIPSANAYGALDLYLNSSGTAVFVITSPNVTAALTAGGLLAILPAESGFSVAMVGSAGRISWAVDLTGAFVPSKIVMPLQSVGRTALTADVQSSLVDAAVGANIKQLPSETGKSLVAVDSTGRISWTVEGNGWLYPRGLIVPQAAYVDDNPALSIAQRLFSAPIGANFVAMPPESGYTWAFVDINNRVIFGIPTIGSTIQATVTRAISADNAISAQSAAESANYLVFMNVDGTGKRQLQTVRKSDGQVFALTTTGNNIDPKISYDGSKVLFTSDASGAYTRMYVPIEGGPQWPLLPALYASVIDAWGDSLTAGAGSSGTGAGQGPWPLQLAAMLGRTVNNYGIGGQTSTQIAARQGGSPTLVTVTSNQIPASGGVAVTAKTVNILTNSGSFSGAQTGSLAGVPGTMTTDASGNWTFTRTTAGTVVACPAATPFVPDLGVASQTHVQALEVGRNNITPSSQVIADLTAVIAYQKAYSKRFFILNILNGTTEGVGTGNYNNIIATNAAVAAAFPGMVVDVRSPPTNEEMTTLGFVPNSTDLADIANDCIPTGMRNFAGSDTLHLNNYGYALWTLRIFRFLTTKGW